MLKDALGAWRGSEEEITRLIEADPVNPDAWHSRAGIRSASGDLAGALEDLTMAIKLGLRFRERITAWGNRGLIRCQTGDYEGAIEDFSAVIEARPRKSIMKAALVQRALAKEKFGDREGSAADRRLARILSPEMNKQTTKK
ncbi:tetratricopeptide repeat protein [Chlorobaculum sp. 24CR]|jgi:regulator of sirC expression with transglutaminase-like and TPR domain|uniref:tetratricopeptide repeat protein n=1 Tax=Chlorobaculum sp. 24CR TaxID=2508878 RepID=UPI00100A4D7B|nr:tetratricopeptide repeat protein [Chlorobaculum sp. 24CR]RXK87561.1 tetratricopeptide repeat protein [Chlorobaculum sp. 24CR]